MIRGKTPGNKMCVSIYRSSVLFDESGPNITSHFLFIHSAYFWPDANWVEKINHSIQFPSVSMQFKREQMMMIIMVAIIIIIIVWEETKRIFFFSFFSSTFVSVGHQVNGFDRYIYNILAHVRIYIHTYLINIILLLLLYNVHYELT